MFQNNNGAVVKNLTKASLHASKRRNIFIILTIAISACLMATISLISMGVRQERINEIDGMYQAAFLNVSQETLAALKADSALDGAGEYVSISEKETENYSVNCVYVDDDTIRLGNFIWEGYLPKQERDVMLERAYLTKIKQTADIGDTVVLDFGDGEKEYHVTGFIQFKSKSADATNYSVIRSQSSFIANDASRIVYIRVSDSSGMSANTLENAIYNVAQRHGIARKDVSMSYRYFNAIEPIRGGNLLIMAGIAVVVAFASVLVIYSIFYISVTGKVREYGQLRTIGMTKKQIQKLVSKEGYYLSLVGIPIGLLVACLLAAAIVPKGWNITNAGKVCFTTAILTFIIVSLAIRRPMKIAAATSPVEAIRYSAASNRMKAVKTKKIHRRITPLHLAVMNFSRNRKKSVLTLLSLGFSGVLLMCAASYSSSLSAETMARGELFSYGEFQLSLTSKNSNNSDGYAISRIQQDNPLNESMKHAILEIDGVTDVQIEKATKIHYTFPDGTRGGDFVSGFSENETDRINSKLQSGTCDYRQCMEQNGIIVMVASVFEEIYGKEPIAGDKLTFEFYTAGGMVQKEYTVLGVMDARLKEGSFLMPEEALQNIMDRNINSQFSIATKPEKKDSVKAELRTIAASNPFFQLDILDDIIIEKSVEAQTYSFILYAIVLVVTFFGIINLVNTTVTNILSRRQELGVLQAIGLSNRQLNCMLQSEGMIYTLSTIIATLTAGTGLGWLLCKGISHFSEVSYINYHFPLVQAILFIAVFLMIQIAISYVSNNSLKKQSLTEQMREL
ncbi:MAG: ABC transporter permease [Lachnospiraceae bacterium]|nr:ABC transporter permease [Lachnospiraceae bacterium]